VRRQQSAGWRWVAISSIGVTAMVLASCAGAVQAGAPTTSSVPAARVTAPVETPRPGESEGAFLFRTHCSACHGATGEGELGPPLQGIADRMTEVDQIAVVKSGKGEMPPFAPSLSDDQVRAVVDYTRTELPAPTSTPSSGP
jgi:mono/diheme cytochrome c family protein